MEGGTLTKGTQSDLHDELGAPLGGLRDEGGRKALPGFSLWRVLSWRVLSQASMLCVMGGFLSLSLSRFLSWPCGRRHCQLALQPNSQNPYFKAVTDQKKKTGSASSL